MDLDQLDRIDNFCEKIRKRSNSSLRTIDLSYLADIYILDFRHIYKKLKLTITLTRIIPDCAQAEI